jgi:hypothetical protein
LPLGAFKKDFQMDNTQQTLAPQFLVIDASISMSLEIKLLLSAMSKAQSELKQAKKESTNPYFNSKYADLASIFEACRKALADNGLSIIQIPAAEDRKVMITSLLGHNSGQWIAGKLTVVAKDNSPQGIGSAITYAKRYALSSLIGISADDDDDGNAGLPPRQGTIKPPTQPANKTLSQDCNDKPESTQPPQVRGRGRPPANTLPNEKYAATPEQNKRLSAYLNKAGVDFLAWDEIGKRLLGKSIGELPKIIKDFYQDEPAKK